MEGFDTVSPGENRKKVICMPGGGFGAFLAHSSVLNHLKDAQFPCSKQDLIDLAEDNHAPEKVIEAIEKLPDKMFDSTSDLTEHLSSD